LILGIWSLFDIWCLGFCHCLIFGAWDFGHCLIFGAWDFGHCLIFGVWDFVIV
jgi:hypothetical protein